MKSVLSTKLLNTAQKNLVLQAGLALVQYDAINRQPIYFKMPEQHFDALIFTSQFAINHFFTEQNPRLYTKKKIFCVGEKSKALLEKLDLKVTIAANDANELGEHIIAFHKKDSFLFCCGDSRREELPALLSKYNIRYKELMVYKTTLAPKSFQRNFDGVMFFSPSGVESYAQKNKLDNIPAFCIGNTTAASAKKYTDKIIVASKPSVENVIVQAAKYFDCHRQGNDQRQLHHD